MKAKLIFDLPEDQQDFNRATKSSDMAAVLWEFASNCRKKIQWELEANDKDINAYDGVELCFKHFYELLQENNINIDELY